jgi:flagellar biosynthesis chaperone FliJ
MAKKELEKKNEEELSGLEAKETSKDVQEFIKRADEEIDALRDKEGHVPKEIHNWLSAIGKKGRATPPKSVEERV